MKSLSQRELARKLNVSVATVSLALKQDKRLRIETIQRVLEAARANGYSMDPIVSEGLSRARRRDFYRETLAWCSDSPHEEQYWLSNLFTATENKGRSMGYNIDYYRFDPSKPSDFKRLCRVWNARGIHGVILGPCDISVSCPSFSWDDLVWVAIGYSLRQPFIHRVARDLDADITKSLEWLARRGAVRPAFQSEPILGHIFGRSLLRGALTHYYGQERAPHGPYAEFEAKDAHRFMAWFRKNNFDSLVCPRVLESVRSLLPADIPIAILSDDKFERSGELRFEVNYELMGQAAITLMHHLLADHQRGTPRSVETVLISSTSREL